MNPSSGKAKCAARAAMVTAAITTLLLAAGCGFGGGGNGGGGGGGGNSGFSNASLKGQYAFTLRGIGTPDNLNSFFFVEAGVFTADGNGKLTSGTDDLVENFTPFSDNITGVYAINSDGSGNVRFDFPSGGSALYRVTLSDASHFYMEEADGFGTSAGSGEKQDTSAFASVPSGTFVFQTHDLAAGNSKVGVTTWNAGQITGTEDVLTGGVLLSPVSMSGTAAAPGSTTGRGTMTISDDTGTSSYIYYVVNSKKLRFLNATAVSSLAIGQAEGQTVAPFSPASLNGTYVFGSAGESFNVDGIHSVGLFTADGTGNVAGGSFDTVQDGNPVTNISLNADSSYSVDASGRAVVTLHLSSGTTNQKVMYLVSPSRAYFLVNDPINVEDGTLDRQTGSPFSNGSMKGQYAFVMDGFDATAQFPYRDRVGTWTPNGSGSVSTSYRASGFNPSFPPTGSFSDNTLSGTYSTGSSGRTTSAINGVSSNLILYMGSNNSGYILQADTGVDIGGAFVVQVEQ
ncbi:MAG TPA: hypothetical protein VF311_01455 [Terriglobales bacterium]